MGRRGNHADIDLDGNILSGIVKRMFCKWINWLVNVGTFGARKETGEAGWEDRTDGIASQGIQWRKSSSDAKVQG